MTKPKDEAWKAHVEEYDRDRFDSTSRHRRHCFDAGWEAALANTLGMLEEIAGRYGISLVQTHDQPALALSVMAITDAAHDGFRYVGPKGEISRAEAEALLAREEKKE